MENQGIPKPILIGGAIIIFLLFFGSKMFVNIKPGEKAVQFLKHNGFDNVYNGGSWKDVIYMKESYEN